MVSFTLWQSPKLANDKPLHVNNVLLKTKGAYFDFLQCFRDVRCTRNSNRNI